MTKQKRRNLILFAIGLAVLSLQTAFITAPNCAAKKKEEKIITQKNVRIDGVLYREIKYKKITKSKKKTIALLNCKTKGKVLPIPSVIHGLRVTILALDKEQQWRVNDKQKFNKITIPETVEKIEKDVFAGVSAQQIILPSSLKTVGKFAFSHCKGKHIIVKGKNTNFKPYAFHGAKIEKISFPTNFQGKLGSGCFVDSELTHFTWPKNLPPKNIEDGIFFGCQKLKKVTFPNGTKEVYIPAGTFTFCKSLKTLVFPKSVKKVTYLNSAYADNYKCSVGTLVFKGKNTQIVGCKYIGTADYNFITVGKIIAPKGSKAIAFAKKAKKITYLPLNERQALEIESPPFLKSQGFFLRKNYSDPMYRISGLLDLGDLTYEQKG